MNSENETAFTENLLVGQHQLSMLISVEPNQQPNKAYYCENVEKD